MICHGIQRLYSFYDKYRLQIGCLTVSSHYCVHYCTTENIRGKHLEACYQFLLTCRPTNVDSERAFSAAGILCTKIRSRLSDTALNKLALLRVYFKKCS